MNFATVINTLRQLPMLRTVAGITMVFAGLTLVAPQGIAASGQKEPASPATAKPANEKIPQKTECINIEAKFIDFTEPALAEVTAPGGVLEKLAPTKSSANVVHILAPEQLDAIFRVLNRTKGVDLACTPTLTVKSGQRNKDEIAREMKYPTKWVFDKKLQQHTPTAFEVKKTGVMLEAEVTAKPGGEEIDLHAIPQFVEFLGYQSAGSNTLTEKPDPHHPYAPVFRTRKADTKAELFSGQTLLLWLGNPLSEKEKQAGQRATAVLVTAKRLSDL